MTRTAGTGGVFRTIPLVLVAGVVAAGCATGQGGEAPLGAEGECHEGVLRVSGADPFPEIALVSDEGSRLEIEYEATDLPALSGTIVRLCTSAPRIEDADDIVAFDLLEVEGVPAILGRVVARRVTDESGDVRIELSILQAAEEGSFTVVGGAGTLSELAGRCAWVAGRVADGAIAVESFGSAPRSVCELAAGSDAGGDAL